MENNKENFFKEYNIHYFGKYYFYEEEEFRTLEDGEFILSKLKDSNRFDYKGVSYTITRFNNICANRTEENVKLKIEENNINVYINNLTVHLDLIYKFEVKNLEDHVRIATRISEKGENVSCLIYIDHDEANNLIEGLEYIKQLQKNYKEGIKDNADI